MRDGVSLTLTVSGVQDAFGNPIDPAANSASCAGMGAAPVFSDLMVMPPKAGLGEKVTITFAVSETLQTDPEVTINGHPATAPYGKAEGYIFEYEVQESDPLGMAVIHISGADLAGNIGTLSNTALLEIVEAEPGLSLWGWPWAAALLLMLGLVLLWRRRLGGARVWTEWTVWTARTGGTTGLSAARSPFEGGGAERRGMFFLFVVLTLACSWAFAQAPTVSNVTMTQVPNATSTQVDIYYDLDAPNGPCAITVSLSKDGGADGFMHPVTSVVGDLSGVTTGTGYHIVWDIRADYPEEDLPNAQVLITADDGVVIPEVASFTINNDAVTTADPVVTLDNTAMNSPTEYMASEESDFSGATWQPYETAPTFTLSSVEGGTKTVYFKIRNAAGESAPISDTITLVEERTILLPGDVPLDLVWVPSGSYQMGRYPGEAESSDIEDPQHPVTLAYGFWMGKYELTQQQWLAVRGSWPQFAPSATYGIGDTYPAYFVSWNDAKNFITTLNAHIVSSGQGPLALRLPSEAEWEYSCRASTQTRFYWGDDLTYTEIGTYAWCYSNNSPSGTKPVGGKLPNAFGLHDMSGNVQEWCEDDVHWSYTGAPADGSAWIDSPRAESRFFRGGAYGSSSGCRSAARLAGVASARGYFIGFRLAADLPPTVTDFAINGGASTTADPVVTLDNTTDNRATEFMASEASDFSGATWQAYGTAPTFTLSSAEGGTKTVYFKVRNAAGESAPISDTINLVEERTILLPGDVPLDLVWVPSGTYQMGRYPGELDGASNEDPQHPVMLAYGFWMGKYEITQQQWLAVRGSWPQFAPSATYGIGDTYPAYWISWNDAKDFITSLNAHIVSSGQGPLTVRLPSEAEWEYACRAGTQTRFYWGDDLTYTAMGMYAWYNGNNSPMGCKPVGSKIVNAFGLYDMSGNMWEWCDDDYHTSYTGAPADGGAWINSPRASYRTIRGGAWWYAAKNCRSAFRYYYLPHLRTDMIGFRLAASFNVTSFAINNGATTTADPVVTLNNTCVGAPTEYMASESPDFSGASWQSYDTAPTFTLSSAEGGTKTVYFKVRNTGGESVPVSDTIELTGQTITLPGDVPLELVWVPGGTFMMGRYPGEADSSNREDPQHPVTMPYGFWMGKYEITQQQWFAVQGSWPGLPPYSSNGMGDTYPVYYVSWYAASGFVTSLNAHIVSSGQGPLTVRLPSEAEWEYAARAGTTTRFYFGDSLGCDGLCTDCAADMLPGNRTDYMWYCGNNSPGGSKPVGGKLPNAFGLYDMSGNVYEWCEDDGHYDYLGAPSDGSAWVDSPRGVTRVYRGGEWSYYASRCRSAYRYTWGPGNSGYHLGLRIAAVPTQVVSFVLNGGAAATADPVVTLDNTATNSPTEYMASESPDFSDTIWEPYDTAPTFTLSSAEGGTKIVYFKVRNAGGESAPVSDTINLPWRTITLPGDVPLELVWVPAGSFQMGRYPGEANSYAEEDPQHPVTLLYGFWMGKYEITQQQWLAVQGSWPGAAPSSTYGLGNTYPAYNVSWNDTKNFITSLNTHIVSSGQGPLTVRLPSEAEWEYACRAGTATRFYFGDSLGCDGLCTDCAAGVLPGNRTDYMWYCGNNSPNGSKPVGGKTGNAFGLYDISGNVYEWCEDDYHSSYTGVPNDGSPWMDSPRAEYRMRRGGSCISNAWTCRSAFRSYSAPDLRYNTIGFRLAALPTKVLSLAINGGAATTTDLLVTLDNTATNRPTEYMASESLDFSGATWQPYGTAPSFTLSFGVGGRMVYFKLRGADGQESEVASDTIFVLPDTVSVGTGTFTMGRTASGDDALYGTADELPQHEVTLGAYQIGKYEVTNKEYCDVLNWAKAKGYLYTDVAGTPWTGLGFIYAGGTADSRYVIGAFSSTYHIQYSGGVFTSKTSVGLPGTTIYAMDTHPMVHLSWYGAVAFCNWLSEWQGLTPCYDMNSPEWPLTIAPATPGGYRLPTEAEWERAAAWESAGGGKHWIYSFISDTLTGKDRANYIDHNPSFVNPLGLTSDPYTSPAGWFNGVNVSPNGSVATVDSPSPVGAYDMSGNVSEMCHDRFSNTYYSGGAMTNPTGPATGSSRVVRGGSYLAAHDYSRSAKRMTSNPTDMNRSFGFRLAKSEPSVGMTSFAINNGDATTTLPTVTLNNTCWGAPTEYMASEFSDFSGAIWQPYDTAPSFSLSSGEGGTKTIYFKVRFAGGESATVSDTIELTGRTVTLPGDVPLELVWVPSGSFQMGRYPGEVDSVSSEDPQHDVTLAYGFWMGKYEVTQQQWLAVRGAWPGAAPSSGWGLGNTYPAYNISWDDVQDFNTSLNAHLVSSGQGPLTVRLPSEAEWEYACRADTQTRFYWGDDPGYTEIGAYAWYSTGATNPVGGKTANTFGLYDMSGNVFEWCEDDYHDGYTGAPADGSAWMDTPRAAIRIVRGGSWGSDASYCRSAFRSGYTAGGRGTNYGFRLVAVP